jgi:chromosome segregation ATPase
MVGFPPGVSAKEINQEILALRERLLKAKKMMDNLEITHNDSSVSILDLYSLFSDEAKMEELVAKLHLKSFW